MSTDQPTIIVGLQENTPMRHVLYETKLEILMTCLPN